MPVKSYMVLLLNMVERNSPALEEGDVPLWDRVGRVALYLLGFLLPFWALPITANPLGLNKVALAYFLILVSFLAWLIGRIKDGKVVLPKNFLALALVVLVLVWTVSGIFSVSRHASFFELSDDPSSVIAVLMFVLTGFLFYFFLRASSYIFIWFLGFFASAFLVFIYQLFLTGFGLNIFPWINFQLTTSNLVGSWSEFGLYFGLVGLLSLFLYETAVFRPLKPLFLILTLLSLVVLAAVNNRIIWWVFFAFLLVFLAYIFSARSGGIKIFRPTFILILVVLLFIQSPALSAFITSFFGTESLEIRPSWPATWTVVQEALKENMLLGSGPATFVYDWLRYKPHAVNQSLFWNVRFASGAAFLPSLLAMIGLLGMFAIIFLAGSFLFYGLRALVRTGETKVDPLLVFIFFASLVILVYSAFYSLNFLLALFLFAFLGMFTGLAADAGLTKEFQITLFQNSGIGFTSALAIIFLVIASFSGLYIFGQKYAAAYFFGRALEFGVQGNSAAAEQYFIRAYNLDQRDQYFRGAAEAGLSQLSLLLNRADLTPDDLRGRFQNVLSFAIQNAQASTRLNPADPLNHATLGRIYEAVIPFQISGASDFALSAYREAAGKNPTSPEPIFLQARVELALKKIDAARTLLEEALKLKTNYTPAHLMLAQIEDAAGNLNGAIERAEAAVILSPGDLGALFQLGLLYYRAERFEAARNIFAQAVNLNPNYSNARYFLGLIYDRFGDKNAAIEQFERVQAFNLANEEVKTILKNLRAGKRALSGISPPGPEPAERERAPVED